MKNTYETLFINKKLECPLGRRKAIRALRNLGEHDVAMYGIVINRGCGGVAGGIGVACDNSRFRKVSLARGPTRGVVETAEVSTK